MCSDVVVDTVLLVTIFTLGLVSVLYLHPNLIGLHMPVPSLSPVSFPVPVRGGDMSSFRDIVVSLEYPSRSPLASFIDGLPPYIVEFVLSSILLVFLVWVFVLFVVFIYKFCVTFRQFMQVFPSIGRPMSAADVFYFSCLFFRFYLWEVFQDN